MKSISETQHIVKHQSGDILMLIPMLSIKGIVVSLYWSWFMCPIGFPSIGIIQSLGISYLFIVLTPAVIADLNKIPTALSEIIRLIFLLFIGFIIHLAMIHTHNL